MTCSQGDPSPVIRDKIVRRSTTTDDYKFLVTGSGTSRILCGHTESHFILIEQERWVLTVVTIHNHQPSSPGLNPLHNLSIFTKNLNNPNIPFRDIPGITLGLFGHLNLTHFTEDTLSIDFISINDFTTLLFHSFSLLHTSYHQEWSQPPLEKFVVIDEGEETGGGRG